MRTQNDIRVTVRVDRDLKECADSLFERLGMNMTTALNVFLRKAVEENAIPFPVSAKPAGFGAGYAVDEITRTFAETVAGEIAYNRTQGFPIARYDASIGRAYLENADGTREYVGNGR
ncbi:MAG: type II toxin-antitoxin system RelB/DinJ family antitoxin [Clostridiales bacterium]|nr:type II toxin-antitoxin system RelB/DinJ family antitoxin [Clostridiales bacterium]